MYTYTWTIWDANHQIWPTKPLNGWTTPLGQEGRMFSFFTILKHKNITSRASCTYIMTRIRLTQFSNTWNTEHTSLLVCKLSNF